jgi:hypothetical protein
MPTPMPTTSKAESIQADLDLTMSASSAQRDDLAAIEKRIWSLLDPYRAELEEATIYGLPSLRWPGAKAHDYFASVNTGKNYVSLYLLPADTYPEALAGTPEALLKRRSGKAAFNFPKLDDQMAGDLEELLARLYEQYRADHA